MSSILDALNKLEAEKAQSRRELEEDRADPTTAAHDLVGRSVLRDRVTVRVSPATLIVSVAAFLTAVVLVAIAVAVMMSGSSEPAVTASASSEAAPAASPAVDAAPLVDFSADSASTSAFVRLPDPQATPMPQQVQSAPPPLAPPPATINTQPVATPPQQPAPEPAPAAVATPEPAAQSRPEPPAEPVRAQAEAPRIERTPDPAPPARPEPEPQPTRVARNTEDISPRSSRTLPGAEAVATRAPRPENLDDLPILTDSDIARFGLTQLRINMPSPAGPANPQGSAILTVREEADDGSLVTNTMKFYEGQRIQSTSLRLFKVERTAVGIEDMRSGQRYQLRF